MCIYANMNFIGLKFYAKYHCIKINEVLRKPIGFLTTVILIQINTLMKIFLHMYQTESELP